MLADSLTKDINGTKMTEFLTKSSLKIMIKKNKKDLVAELEVLKTENEIYNNNLKHK